MKSALFVFLLILALPVPSQAESGKAAVNFTHREKKSFAPAEPHPKPAVAVPESVPAEPSVSPVPVESVPPVPEIPPPSALPVIVPPVVPLPVAAPPVPAPRAEELWLDDDIPEDATAQGVWLWDEVTVAHGKRSHGHPSARGIQSHTIVFEPKTLPPRSMIVQQVWLDPQDPPRGVALWFKRAAGGEVGVYWEGEEELFDPTEYDKLWYQGLLPELGRWTALKIPVEDLSLEGDSIAGIRFVTLDGRALWDETVLTQTPSPEESPAPAPTPVPPS